MNTTKHDSFMVWSSAERSSARLRRWRITAMISAPIAPMAPPSVGVATPRKMVPSTRKIRPSGGISTKVTRSAMRDSRPSLSPLLASASVNARPTPTQSETTINSSVGVLAGRLLAKARAHAVHRMNSQPSERRPDWPLDSRIVRASGGSAGT